jgi:hypothetical protein
LPFAAKTTEDAQVEELSLGVEPQPDVPTEVPTSHHNSGTSLSTTLGSAAEVANVVAYGADNTGVVDSALACQAALNAHKAIYFPPGTYLINTSCMTGSNKYIYGNGATLKVGPEVETTLSITGDNVTIEGLRFLGTATDHAASDVGASALTIDATANRENISIHNCTFEWALRGIWFMSPDPVDPGITLKNLNITGCTFRNCIACAIALRKGKTQRGTNYTVQNLRVATCHFEDIYFTSDYIYSGAIYIGGGAKVNQLTITGCTSKNCITAFLAVSGTGMVDTVTLTGCQISGEPDVGTTIHNRMGIDINNAQRVTVSGCTFDYFREECIALLSVPSFAISGCTFRRANVGIGLYRLGSTGTITGCTFHDMEDPSGVKRARYGILLAKVEHHVTISGCRFEQGNAVGGVTGIRIQDTAHPSTLVTGCDFIGLERGVNFAGKFNHQIAIQACRFVGITVGAIDSNTSLINSMIANCIFASCVADIEARTTRYLYCNSNYHKDTMDRAINLGNANWINVVNCLFENVATVYGETGAARHLDATVTWENNVYAGTTTPLTDNQG